MDVLGDYRLLSDVRMYHLPVTLGYNLSAVGSPTWAILGTRSELATG